MIGTFHHSYLLPWIGYFTKLEYSDIFVILDDVGFRRNHIKRVQILNSQGEKYWITIPVGNNWGMPCNIIKIPTEKKFVKRIIQTIEFSYGKAEHFHQEIEFIIKTLTNAFDNNEFLVDANTHILNEIREYLGLKKIKIVKSSQFGNFSDRTDRIVSIAKLLNINKIIIGGGNMRNVHNIDEIIQSNITLYEQSIFEKIEPYEQIHHKRDTKFTNGLSIIDVLLNQGRLKTKELIQNIIFTPNKYIHNGT